MALTRSDRPAGTAMENILLAQKNVDVYVAETGIAVAVTHCWFSGSRAPSTHYSRLLPDRNTAKPGETVRVEPTTETIERIRDLAAQIPGAEYTVAKEEMGPPGGCRYRG